MILEKILQNRPCPCLECLLFVMCKIRMNLNNNSITQIANSEKCKKLLDFIAATNQDGVNEGRVKFGLDPIK